MMSPFGSATQAICGRASASARKSSAVRFAARSTQLSFVEAAGETVKNNSSRSGTGAGAKWDWKAAVARPADA
ncbi:hypothetical protein MRA01_55520 [Methylobacterium radiotolerans]|nr:hypothetical protein MRA01_55520 [Methylobacterium radiotolerans]